MNHAHPAILIANTPRTGSSYLSRMFLDNCGCHLPEMRTLWTTENLRDQSTSSRHWGMRCFGWLIYELERIWPPEAVPFRQSRFIALTREDLVAQAVSYVKATQSHYWFTPNDEERPDDSVFTYDAERIQHFIDKHRESNATWDAYFIAHGITPHRITYETLFMDVDSAFQAICEFLCIPFPEPCVKPNMQKLGDAHSAEWIARFNESRISNPKSSGLGCRNATHL